MRNETLGQVFKRYRQTEKKKIEQIEKDLNISKRMILAIENDQYKILPDELYTKNIIKAYAQYLSLDYNKLLVLYEASKEGQVKNENQIKTAKSPKVYLTPQRSRNILIALVILFLVGYLVWQIKLIYEPPELFVFEPGQDLITDQKFIEIKGTAEKEASVYINEKEVFLSPQGKFKATLDLQNGLNLIKISAVKKHSQENTVYRKILVQ